MKEVNADREEHGKKPFDDDDHNEPPKETKTVSESTTDPDSGVSTKVSTKNALLMKHIPPATGIISCWT